MWIRLLMVPYHLLYPAVLMFICVGTYLVSNSAFDVWLVVIFGIAGYVMRLFAWPAAPLLLGFVLGPLMEEHFRRAMLMSRGSFMTLIERPIAATILALTVVVLFWGFYSTWKYNRRMKKAALA